MHLPDNGKLPLPPLRPPTWENSSRDHGPRKMLMEKAYDFSSIRITASIFFLAYGFSGWAMSSRGVVIGSTGQGLPGVI